MKAVTMKSVLALLLLWAAAPLCAPAAPEHTPAPAAQAALERAQTLEKDKKMDEALAAFYQAIEADPDFLAAHDGLVEFQHHWKLEIYQQDKEANFTARIKEMNNKIDAKYGEWERRFPNSLGILYGTAVQLNSREDPRARPYLLKVAELDPTNVKVYPMLAGDAFMSGDEKSAAEYLHKAATLEPNNAEYAYMYARAVEPAQRQAAIEDVIKRFPNTETGAIALYWLGEDEHSDAQRIVYFEQLRTQFPPEKFRWGATGMWRLFETYMRVDPAKAVILAQDMQTAKASPEWAARVELAQTFVEVNKMLAADKATEALALLDKLKPEHRSGNTAMVERLKARVMAGAGQAQGGYQVLLALQAQEPDDETQAALQTIGRQLHKSAAQVQTDIKAAVDVGAKPAPPFNLQQYTSADTLSLAKLRGKVVLLTFWFPGCGPCAREFPHFEAVMQQFHHNKDVVYIGINMVRDQDAYVLPRIEKMGYSFTPLKGTDSVTKGKGAQGFNVAGAPTNFVIDRKGRIVYHNFMIDDPHGELMVQRMIESVL
jgi:thiol-disulfide isomerase/thioredoxin